MLNGRILLGLSLDARIKSDAVHALLRDERKTSNESKEVVSFYSPSLAILLGHEEITDLFIE